MKLIVGLGNPGEKYAKTRHNAGFMALDEIISHEKYTPFRLEGSFNTKISQTGGVGEDRIIFAKPQTFMNNSGEAVKKILDYYHIGTDDLLVIYDDIDLIFGEIRTRSEGSSGGHKGVESIIKYIKTDRFARIKIGIKNDKSNLIPTDKFVLENFSKKEEEELAQILDKTKDIILKWAIKGEANKSTYKVDLKS